MKKSALMLAALALAGAGLTACGGDEKSADGGNPFGPGTSVSPSPTTETPTDLPTDLATDLPTDLLTDLPTDLPTDLLTDEPTDEPTTDSGDSSTAPSNASQKDFCGTFLTFGKKMVTQAEATPAQQLKVLHEVADEMLRVGTPADMPQDVRAVYLKGVETMRGLDVASAESDMEALDALDNDGLTAYMSKTCAEELAGIVQ